MVITLNWSAEFDRYGHWLNVIGGSWPRTLTKDEEHWLKCASACCIKLCRWHGHKLQKVETVSDEHTEAFTPRYTIDSVINAINGGEQDPRYLVTNMELMLAMDVEIFKSVKIHEPVRFHMTSDEVMVRVRLKGTIV